MPNITISGLPLATLPLDGANSFFEVQTTEAGETVSRKVAADDVNLASAIVIEDEGVPLAGGADTLDFVGPNVVASGAGSTKTITISGGGVVDSVIGGTNINVDAGDPINPIVNLDAAITGVSVNGVTLSNAGAATDFLNEQGNYVAPAGGIGGTIADNQVAIGNGVDAIDGSADFTWDGNFLTVANASGILVRDGGFVRLADPDDTAFATFIVDAADELVTTFSNVARWRIIDGVEIRIEDAAETDWMTMQHDGQFMTFGQFQTQGLRLNDLPLYLEERAAANADELTYGQLWVNSASGNLNFTDELGTDTDLIAAAFDPTADIDFTGACTFTNAAGDLQLGVSTSLHFRNNADTSQTFIQNLGPTFQFGIAGADFGSGIFEIGSSWLKVQINRSIFFDEKAAQGTPVAGDGEFWVRNDTPCVPMFTDDVGTDFVLNAAGGAVTQLEDGAANPATVAEGLGITAIRSVGNIDGEGREVEWQNQNGTTRASLGTEFFTDFIMRNHLVGGSLIFRVGTGGGSRIRAHMSGDAAVGGFSAYAGTSAVPMLQTHPWGVEVGNGTLFLVDQAAPEADIANQGQLWVNQADDQLNYIPETGTPQVLDPSLSEINDQDNDYTLLLTDKGKTIRRTTNGFAETWTIPAEASVDYPIGTWVAFYNDGGNTTSIAITTDLMRGTDGFTGTRTLGDNQRALIQKVASALWVYQATDL